MSRLIYSLAIIPTALLSGSPLLPEEIPFFSDEANDQPVQVFQQLRWPPVIEKSLAHVLLENEELSNCTLNLAWSMVPFPWTDADIALEFASSVLPEVCRTDQRFIYWFMYAVSCQMTPGYPEVCETVARRLGFDASAAERVARVPDLLAIKAAADHLPDDSDAAPEDAPVDYTRDAISPISPEEFADLFELHKSL